MTQESPAITIAEIILGVALVGGLFGAGWSVYRRLPSDEMAIMNTAVGDSGVQTNVTVALRKEITGAMLNSPVELYPFDLVAAQREFNASPHLAREFDDFLLRRMHGIAPVKAATDNGGRATATVRDGDWWLHATAVLSGGETIEWRLPITVTGHEQAIELTMENAYERTKKF